jgi:serine/threonine protein kinase
VIDAINKLHDHEFLYLDLKPANIYLNHDGSPLLLDFGGARRTLEESGRRLNWVYTKGYAAPELLLKRREGMGPWTDAYGIGATIFACMCGYPPQPADQRGMKDRMPRAFKKLRKLYSSDLLDLVEWCLQLDREKRPQTMSALQERLQACQPKQAPLPRRGLIRRFSNWIRKKIKAGSSVVKHN